MLRNDCACEKSLLPPLFHSIFALHTARACVMGNIHALNCCTNPRPPGYPPSRRKSHAAVFARQSLSGDTADQMCMTDVEHMPSVYSWVRELPRWRANIHASHGFVNQAHTLHQHSSTPSTSEPLSSSHDVQSPGNETEQPSLRNVGVRNENLSLNFRVRNENLSIGYSSGPVFLSYSDKQEDFTEQLWIDLNSVKIFCFFHKHSLLKDEVFPRRIFDAAEKCKVAVVVLSQDFINSRWSMQELCALVEARESTNRKLRICPLYFKTTPRELSQQIESIERDGIPEAWEHIMNPRKERIGRAACLRALRTLRGMNGRRYNQMEGEVAYRRQIVRDIRSLLLKNEKHKDPSSDPLETREKISTRLCSLPETIPSSGMEASEFGLWAIARSHQMRRRKGGQKLTHLEPSSSGDIDEALSSDYLWEQVFLSYSAKQRAVVEQLYIDLTGASISCFFDRRSFSEGQRFNPPHSFEAPETCEVAIVVVSEDYIASELAMLQLCAFVEAEKTVNSKLKIYPLFYQMSPDEFSQRIDYIKEKGFPESWSKFANFSQRSTGFMSLLEALEALRSYEKPLYVQNDGMADYRHKLLCDVHRLLSPNIKGKERLCQVVANLFKQAPCYNDGVKVIGLYGIDGSGKTTLCKSLCGFYFDHFKGKVFHAEFHKQEPPVETLKGLLRTLTDANEESMNLVGNYEQALSLLKQQMSNQRVFLCLDNIPDRLKSVKEAQAYLTAGFGMGSLVLLTARSMEILERVIPEARKRSFVRVPNLCEEEAIDVLLNLSEVKARNLTSEERYKVAEYADLCRFGEGMSCREGSYHPLALTVLGAYLCEKFSCNPSQWLPTPGFSEYPNAQEFMFHIIEQTINAFDPVSLRILLLLIFSVPNLEFVLNFNHSIFRWIADVCPDESNQSVRDAIYGMKIRGLLEGRGRNSISFHNTVVEFGKSKLKEMKQSLSLEGKDEVPNAVASSVVKVLKLTNYTPSRTFPFNQFRNVSVVHLERVWSLETLNFESMRAVRSITIVECYALREIRGLCGLSSPLRFLKVEGCEALVQCPEIGGLKQLRHLHMQLEADIDKILRVGLETCFCLKEIYLDGICYVSVPRRLRRVRSITINNSHYCVVPLDFTDCLKLQWIKLWNCNGGYPSLNLTRCINVRSIYVRKNDDITEIVGLDELIALEELHLIDMNSIEKLPSFRQLENLSHLTLQNMAKLKELPDLSNCHRLQSVDIDSKLLYMMCPN